LLRRNDGALTLTTILSFPAGFALMAVTNPDEAGIGGRHAG